MSQKNLKNISASIRQKLLNKARFKKRPFSELIQYFAMERFLYRLSKSPYAGQFILKGALMLQAWQSPIFRPTMDIDMLGKTNSNEATIKTQIREIITIDIEPDGLTFNPETIQSERITRDIDYEGLRIIFQGKLGTASFKIQIDIGFGDVVFPRPEKLYLPTMLDFPPVNILCYSRESTIAEKFEAMLKLHELNSRMKDFYDIWLLSRQFDFEGKKLSEAISKTLKNRGTDLPEEITAFSETFTEIKQVQWLTFRKKLKQEYVPVEFAEVISKIKDFLTPIINALHSGNTMRRYWTAKGFWK